MKSINEIMLEKRVRQLKQTITELEEDKLILQHLIDVQPPIPMGIIPYIETGPSIDYDSFTITKPNTFNTSDTFDTGYDPFVMYDTCWN